MKSFSSMYSSPSTQPAMVIRNGLLVLLTGLLLIWLEGGYPPTVWVLLLQVGSHLDTLSAQHGQGILWILAGLIGQALLLVAAWSVLIWLAIPGGVSFFRSRFASPTERSTVRNTHRARPSGANEQKASVSPAPSSAARENDLVAKSHLLSGDFFSLLARKSGLGWRREVVPQVQRESAEIPYHNPYAEEVLKNPFEDQMDTTGGGRRRSTKRVDEVLEAPVEPQQEEVSQGYVYGNPFDGQLPEVFEYDTDLKESLDELKQ